MSEKVEGSVPNVRLTIGAANKSAEYEGTSVDGDGNTVYTYTYMVVKGDEGKLEVSAINSTGVLKDKAGNEANLSLVATNGNFVADTKAPEIINVEYLGVGNAKEIAVREGTVEYKITVSDGEIKDEAQVQLIKTTKTGTSIITSEVEGFSVTLEGTEIKVEIEPGKPEVVENTNVINQ